MSLKRIQDLLEGEIKKEAKRWLRIEMDMLVDPLVDHLVQKMTSKLNDITGGFDKPQDLDNFEDDVQLINPESHQPAGHELTESHSTEVKKEFPDEIIVDLIYAKSSQTTTNVSQAKLTPLEVQEEFWCTASGDGDNETECDCTDCQTGGSQEFKSEDSDMDMQEPGPSTGQKQSTQTMATALPIIPQQQQTHVDDFPEDEPEQCITQSLLCTQPECQESELEFPGKDELNEHLLHQHGFKPFRCLLKNCGHSFDNRYQLSLHIKKQAHGSVTKWTCQYCPNHYATYKLLYFHTTSNHHLGRFACSSPGCEYLCRSKTTMANHFRQKHNPTRSKRVGRNGPGRRGKNANVEPKIRVPNLPESIDPLLCNYPNCGHRFKEAFHRRTHEWSHLGIKPYSCAWPSCTYAATQRCGVVNHLLRTHLDAKSNSSVANQYITVDRRTVKTAWNSPVEQYYAGQLTITNGNVGLGLMAIQNHIPSNS